MNRTIITIFSILAISFFVSCSGNYNANPTSQSNFSSNPLNPPAYTWQSQGVAPMSADINGVFWHADSALTTFSFAPSTGNVMLGTNNGEFYIELILPVAYSGNKYSMGYHNYGNIGALYDSFGNPNTSYNYYSYLGFSGGVDVIENDSIRIEGLFYFQGINPYGSVINVTNGYFNITKVP